MNTMPQFGKTKLVDLSKKVLQNCHTRGIRPTIKAFIALDECHKKCHPVASFTSGKRVSKGVRIFNLPGGGVDESCWIQAMFRELSQELPGLEVKEKQLANARVLSMGAVPTTRKQYKGKLLVVVGILLPRRQFGKEVLTPDGEELANMQIATIAQTAMRIQELKDTKPEAAVLYKSALSVLRPLLA